MIWDGDKFYSFYWRIWNIALWWGGCRAKTEILEALEADLCLSHWRLLVVPCYFYLHSPGLGVKKAIHGAVDKARVWSENLIVMAWQSSEPKRRGEGTSKTRRQEGRSVFSVIYAISTEVAMMFEFLRDLVYILVSDIVFESSYLSVICWRRSESQISIAGAIPSWWVMVNEVLNCPVEILREHMWQRKVFPRNLTNSIQTSLLEQR